MKKLIILLCLLASLGWGQSTKIDLTKQIKNSLPIANGGTARTTPCANGELMLSNGTIYNCVEGGSHIKRLKADCGAKGDAVTDDSTAIQTCIDDVDVNGVVFCEPGLYNLGTELLITNSMSFIGPGPDTAVGCSLRTTTATMNAIHIQEDRLVVLDNFAIRSDGTAKTAGAGILVEGSTGASTNTFSRFNRLTITNQWIGVQFEDASSWRLLNSYIVSNENTGVLVRNTVTPDAGDSSIIATTFDNPNAVENLLWNSGGGLKITNSKFLSADLGIDLSVSDGVATSVFLLTGSSMEGCDINCIRMQRDGTTGTFGRIIIVGNELKADTSQTVINFPTAGITTGVIVGNNIVATSGTGITISDDGVDDFIIASNVFENLTTGINVTASGAAVTIGSNIFAGVATPWVRGTSTTILGSDGSSFEIQQTTDSVTGFQIFDADRGTPVLNVDTTNERMGVGTAAPKEILHLEASNPTARIESANASLSMVRLVESTTFLGAYVKYDGAANALQIGVHNLADSTLGNDSIGIAIDRTTDNVTIPSGLLILRQLATEPESCTTALRGSQYYDTSDEELCTCRNDGTDTEWVKQTDPTHTGHCTI